MEDLKIVFYIVVAIIWMIYNNYKKVAEQSKKRNPSQPFEDLPDEVPTENWPSIPKSEPYRPQPQKPRRNLVPTPVPVRRPVEKRAKMVKQSMFDRGRSYFSSYGEPMFNPLLEGGALRPSEHVTFEDSETIGNQTENQFAEQIRNADFRQAIILNEVLQRPYK